MLHALELMYAAYEGEFLPVNTPLSEEEQVVLLSSDGQRVGVEAKSTVHTASTPLHLAFSCYVLNADDQVLLTRRALSKTTWPGVWTNSFCGHPKPGEAIVDAVRRRGVEELGLSMSEPVAVLPEFRYCAVDTSGVMENEICPVYMCRTEDDPTPAQSEVCDWFWADHEELDRMVATVPQMLSPWLVLQLSQAAAATFPAALSQIAAAAQVASLGHQR